jgi:vacuolar-type H+-ATPase subunit E/Vma4
MPLEHLLVALERDADAQAQELRAEARAAAATVASACEERLARRRREVVGAREAELRAAAELALGEARRVGRRAVLEARQRLLERVFAAAQTALPDAGAGANYRGALPGHVAEAVACIGDEPGVIRCPATLVPALRAAVTRYKQLEVRVDATIAAGFRLATADGGIEVDHTLAGHLERSRPRLALELLARLSAKP